MLPVYLQKELLTEPWPGARSSIPAPSDPVYRKPVALPTVIDPDLVVSPDAETDLIDSDQITMSALGGLKLWHLLAALGALILLKKR